jgi:hypothetical protein
LRGDQGSRYAAYAVNRQWGRLSVNNIRRLENLPPIITGSGLTRSAIFTPTAGVNHGKAIISVGDAAFVDLAGNANTVESTFSLTYDTLAPTVASSIPTLSAASDTGVVGDGRTTVTTPVFQGSASPNACVVLYDGTTQLGIATADESGS